MQLMAFLGHFPENEQIWLIGFEPVGQSQNILLVHVLPGIPAEGIHTRIDVLLVGIKKIITDGLASGVQIRAIAGDSSLIAIGGIVPALHKAVSGLMKPVGIGGIHKTFGRRPVVGRQVLIERRGHFGQIGSGPDFTVHRIGGEAVVGPGRIVCKDSTV